jgi:hypothetical protein
MLKAVSQDTTEVSEGKGSRKDAEECLRGSRSTLGCEILTFDKLQVM